MTKQVYF